MTPGVGEGVHSHSHTIANNYQKHVMSIPFNPTALIVGIYLTYLLEQICQDESTVKSLQNYL